MDAKERGFVYFFSTRACDENLQVSRGGNILLLPGIIRTCDFGTRHHDIEYRETYSIDIDRCELTSSFDLQTNFLHLTISSGEAVFLTCPSTPHSSFLRLRLLQLPLTRSLPRLPPLRNLQTKNRSHTRRTGRVPTEIRLDRSLQPRSDIESTTFFKSLSSVLPQTDFRSVPLLPPSRDLPFHLRPIRSSNPHRHTRKYRQRFHSRTRRTR